MIEYFIFNKKQFYSQSYSKDIFINILGYLLLYSFVMYHNYEAFQNSYILILFLCIMYLSYYFVYNKKREYGDIYLKSKHNIENKTTTDNFLLNIYKLNKYIKINIPNIFIYEIFLILNIKIIYDVCNYKLNYI